MSRRLLNFVRALLPLAGLVLPCAGCGVNRPANPAAATPVRTFDVSRFGAAGDGAADDAPSVQRAIDAAAAAGGGRVVLAAGKTYRCGTLRLRARVEFHLEPGSRLLASDRRTDYSAGESGMPSLIEATDAEGFSLTGGGVVDGAAPRFMAGQQPHMYRPGPWRPGLVHLTRCRGARVEGVTFRDSPYWCLHLEACAGVSVEAVTINNDRRVPNADGIDIDGCSDVTVRRCRVVAGDDGIVLKTTGHGGVGGPIGQAPPPPCRNVRVEACDVSSDSCALKIGTETRADVRDVVFDRCTVHDSNRGIGIALRDAGDVRGVTFSNITVETRRVHPDWWGRGEAVYLTVLPRKAGAKPAKLGRLSDVRVINVRCHGEGGVYVRGCAESRPEGLTFEGVHILLQRTSGYPVDEADLRPTAGTGLEPHPAAGFYFRDADGVTLKDCSVRWGRGVEAFSPALECHGVRGFVEENFDGPPPRPGTAARVID